MKKQTRERSRLADAIAACLKVRDEEPILYEAAIKVLKLKLVAQDGVVSRAAEDMEISVRAFRRWLEDDDVRERLDVPRMFVKAP